MKYTSLLLGVLLSAGALTPEGPRLYVANQEPVTVSVIDIETNSLLHTIDLRELGFSANAKPHHTAVEPDGSFWYVSLIGDGVVLKFSRDDELVGRAEFEVPGLLALHPTEDQLFVGRSMAAVNPPQRIGIIRRSDMTIEEIDVFFPRPHALAVDPRGGHIYSGSLAVNQLASIDLETEELNLVDLEGEPHTLVQFALSPDGATMVATGQLTGKLLVFDASDPAEIRLRTSVDVGAQPWHPVFTPDGRYVYVGAQESNTISVVDAATWTVADVIEGEGIAEPHGAAVSPDGRYVYVSNRNLNDTYASREGRPQGGVGTVVVIDTATRAIVKVIEVDRYAAGMSAPASR